MSNDQDNTPLPQLAEAQEKPLPEPLQQLFSQLSASDVAQFSSAYQLWSIHQQIDVLYLQIALKRQEIKLNQEQLHLVQPSALELSTLAQFQANGVRDADLLDRLYMRGEAWLDHAIQLLAHCERMDLIQGDYTQWCEHALEGAYDWISSIDDDDLTNAENHHGQSTIAVQDATASPASYDEQAETLLLRKLFLEAGEEIPEEIEPASTASTPPEDAITQTTSPIELSNDLAVEIPSPEEDASTLDDPSIEPTPHENLTEEIASLEEPAQDASTLDDPSIESIPHENLTGERSSLEELTEAETLPLIEVIEVIPTHDEHIEEPIENHTIVETIPPEEPTEDVSPHDDLTHDPIITEDLPNNNHVTTEDLPHDDPVTTEDLTEEVPLQHTIVEEILPDDQISEEILPDDQISLKNDEEPADKNSEDSSNKNLPNNEEQPASDQAPSPALPSTQQDGNELIEQTESIAIITPEIPISDTDQSPIQEKEIFHQNQTKNHTDTNNTTDALITSQQTEISPTEEPLSASPIDAEPVDRSQEISPEQSPASATDSPDPPLIVEGVSREQAAREISPSAARRTSLINRILRFFFPK